MTPFEFFRTPIQIRRFTQGFYLNGRRIEGSYFINNALLIPGNSITISVNGTVLGPVPYNTSSLNTMNTLAGLIRSLPTVLATENVGDGLGLIILPLIPSINIIDYVSVTGGASQPVATIQNNPILINATASIQPTKGQDVELLPEGRRDAETYKMYTSTKINGIEPSNTPQNPDQVVILKAPFTNIVFEVIQINTWQNNANFNIVNHYKYIAVRLHPLP